MVNLEKGTVIFKKVPEDFIVEEIGEKYTCQISPTSDVLEHPSVDFGKLDCNDRRPFLSCDLEKINLDHFSALTILSKELHKSPHELGYAGTKDKCAWTCQRISIYNPEVDKVQSFFHPGMLLKNFKWAKHKIKIGDLKGNRFTILLRDADKDAIKILNRLRHTQELPNYFGAQRFGSLRKDNFQIGKLLLKKRFKEAVFSYLSGFGEQENEEIKKAKKKFKSEKNLAEAISYFPPELTSERQMLEHLSTYPQDWIGALMILGEKTLLLMCQSVQSRIFNETLERAEDEGLKIANQSLALIGYNSDFSSGRLGTIERETLKSYDLTSQDFNNSSIPFLSLKTSFRKAYFKVQDIRVEIKEDEFYPLSKKIELSFTLDSGTYATTLLEHFFILRTQNV